MNDMDDARFADRSLRSNIKADWGCLSDPLWKVQRDSKIKAQAFDPSS
jgi:hypothetical protein